MDIGIVLRKIQSYLPWRDQCALMCTSRANAASCSILLRRAARWRPVHDVVSKIVHIVRDNTSILGDPHQTARAMMPYCYDDFGAHYVLIGRILMIRLEEINWWHILDGEPSLVAEIDMAYYLLYEYVINVDTVSCNVKHLNELIQRVRNTGGDIELFRDGDDIAQLREKCQAYRNAI